MKNSIIVNVIHISTMLNKYNNKFIIYIMGLFEKGVFTMKLVLSKSNLLTGVQIVSKAVPNKTTMSILECILVDASDLK